ncbi:MAG: hypothetical protein ABGX25_05565 [Nautiliaceae bacterium]
MKNCDKIKVEVDLLRDSLKNIFIVMFAIMSGIIGIGYNIIIGKISVNTPLIILVLCGFISFVVLAKFKNRQIQKLKELLNEL